nr:MAG TPA: hypothetical protein [Caudoviricetes sp.]
MSKYTIGAKFKNRQGSTFNGDMQYLLLNNLENSNVEIHYRR